MTKSAITVKTKKENGWWIGTSPDLKGLIVCHQKYTVFAQEIVECIKLIFRARGVEVEVEEIPSQEGDDPCSVFFEATKKVA